MRKPKPKILMAAPEAAKHLEDVTIELIISNSVPPGMVVMVSPDQEVFTLTEGQRQLMESLSEMIVEKRSLMGLGNILA